MLSVNVTLFGSPNGSWSWYQEPQKWKSVMYPGSVQRKSSARRYGNGSVPVAFTFPLVAGSRSGIWTHLAGIVSSQSADTGTASATRRTTVSARRVRRIVFPP